MAAVTPPPPGTRVGAGVCPSDRGPARSAAAGLRAFLADQRGSAVVALIFLVALLACAALAVDAGFGLNRKAELQSVADAAALAGAARLPDADAAVATALEYANKNVPSGVTGPIVTAKDITLGRWDAEKRTFSTGGNAPTAVRVRARMTTAAGNAAPSFFARVFGVDTLDIGTQAVAGRSAGGLELVLVLDVSGSMASAGKIEALRTAAAALIDIVYGDQETVRDLWVGLAPFSGRVNIAGYGSDWIDTDAGTDGKLSKTTSKIGAVTAGMWGTEHFGPGMSNPKLCTGLRDKHETDDAPPSDELFPPFLGNPLVCPAAAVLPLTAEKSIVKKAIAGLYAGGSTSTAIGMAWGWRLISPLWRGLWGNPELPLDYHDQRVQKAVVIMTDGMNTPEQAGDPFDAEEADKRLLSECKAMKAKGITVFTVTFQAPSAIDSLYEKCASKEEYAFRSPTNTQLKAVFETIGGLLGGKTGLLQ